MTGKEARRFFLKESSYLSLNLPDYISFETVINKAENILRSKKGNIRDINNIIKKDYYLGDIEELNYTIYINKDGHYTWRPISLLHPLIYVDLVNYITQDKDCNNFGWNDLKERFNKFQINTKIKCFSIPGQSLLKNKTDDGTSIINWWKNIEQQSIANSLKYSYCLFTDITDFYPSIYTHSICWAIHGKTSTKENLKNSKDWYGGIIDSKIQRMQHNQTNEIPQGSILMDFISEIILGYIDLKLTEKLDSECSINEYSILRYRDDYRIFSDNKRELEEIIKKLQEVLQSLNIKLNSKKTFFSENIILDSIKPDKLYWEPKRLALRNSYLNKDKHDKGIITLQKHLWQIKEFADKFPNCGMIKKSLTEFYDERVSKLEKNPEDLEILTSILVNIMLEKPSVVPHCVTIIAKLYEISDNSLALDVVNDILEKYTKKSNTEYIEIWLQRLLVLDPESDCKIENTFNSKIVYHVFDPTTNQLSNIFPLDWVNEDQNEIKNINFRSLSLVDLDKYEDMKCRVRDSEIDIFNINTY